MDKRYRQWSPEQTWMFPPSSRNWLPTGHLVSFLMDVIGEVDLAPSFAHSRKSPLGQSPYPPRMMTTLLIDACCTEVFSLRKMMARCQCDAAFRVIVGENFPTSARFN